MKKEDLAKKAAEIYREGRFEDAKQCLLQLLEQGIESAALYNQLGVISNKLHQYDEAKAFYEKALKLESDNVVAMYNLSLNLYDQGKKDEVMVSLVTIIKAAPSYLPAHFTLAKLLLEKKRIDQAKEHFDFIVAEDSGSEERLSQIVALLLQHQVYALARIYCEQLHQLNPGNTEFIYNLALIEAKENNVAEAIIYYQQVLSIKPDHFPSLNNLAVIYLEQKNKSQAQLYFTEALRLQPNNESIQYTLSVLKGDQSVAPPKAYIKDLFNHYADHYDAHLRKGLAYKVPELLRTIVRKTSNVEKPEWDILDLGCGSGLCGEAFVDWSKNMIGVDLAEKMLGVAREKKCYQELILSDVESYLTSCDKTFDLILSADVFIYIGDLRNIIEQAYRCLNVRGFFAFSIELGKKQDYQTQPSGRFAHSEKYIKQLARRAGFKSRQFSAVETRKQDKQSVDGAIVVLQKQA